MAKKSLFPKLPYCEARKYKDGQAICRHNDKDCIYAGDSPTYECPIYPAYAKMQMECERFFAWRRRVNGQVW